MYKIDLLEAKKWEELPNPWKVVKTTKKAKLPLSNIYEDSFVKIFEPFFTNDGLRPAMAGLLVDKDCFVATDAHKLLVVPRKGDTNEEGNYIISQKIAKKFKKKIGKQNEKFPDYKVILRKDNLFSEQITIKKLKTYCEAMRRGKYVNAITNEIKFEINNGGFICLNAEYLIDVLNSFLLLGYERLFVGFEAPNRAIYFAPNRDSTINPFGAVGIEPIGLLMPTIAYDSDSKKYGAINLDFNTESSIYYSFSEDKIINGDGTNAVFEPNLTTKEVPYIIGNELDLLKKLVGSNKVLPILDYILVQNGTAIATNLKETVYVDDILVEDGIYEIVSDAFKNTTYKKDDFPNVYSYIFEDIASFDTNDLKKIVSEAKEFVSDDILRPALTGITFKADIGSNRVRLFSSESHILYTNSLESSNSFKINNSVLYPNNLSFYLNAMYSSMVNFKKEESNYYNRNYMFASSDGKISYMTKDAEATPPNFEQVLSVNTTNQMQINKYDLLNIINQLKKEDIKDGKCLVFDFDSEDFTSNIYNTKEVQIYLGKYDKVSETFSVEIRLGNLTYTIQKNEQSWETADCGVIMPINSKDKQAIGFDPTYLKKVLEVSKDNTTLYFKDGNKISMFLVSLNTKTQSKSTVSQIPQPQTIQKTQSKEDIEKLMKGLEILVKMGNQQAVTKLRAYQIIYKRK